MGLKEYVMNKYQVSEKDAIKSDQNGIESKDT